MFIAEFDSERILKIGQHLPKLWVIKYRVVFLMKHRVDMDDLVDMTCPSCHRYQITVHAISVVRLYAVPVNKVKL